MQGSGTGFWRLGIVLCCAACGAALVPPEGALAADFAVETQVFRGDERAPTAKSVAVFHGGTTYDLLADPVEITILEPAAGKLSLLDVKRRVQTSIELDHLTKLIDELQVEVLKQPESLARFAAQPRFETSYDAERRLLTHAGKWITYKVVGESPKEAGAAASYRRFADSFARLNATRPGALLPFARLTVNEALDRRQLVPREVRVELVQGGKSTTLRSEHAYRWQLDAADRKRVAEAEEFRKAFRTATFTAYYRETARDETQRSPAEAQRSPAEPPPRR